MSRHKTKLKSEKLCHDIEILCRDIEILCHDIIKSSKKETLSRQSFLCLDMTFEYKSLYLDMPYSSNLTLIDSIKALVLFLYTL